MLTRPRFAIVHILFLSEQRSHVSVPWVLWTNLHLRNFTVQCSFLHLGHGCSSCCRSGSTCTSGDQAKGMTDNTKSSYSLLTTIDNTQLEVRLRAAATRVTDIQQCCIGKHGVHRAAHGIWIQRQPILLSSADSSNTQGSLSQVQVTQLQYEVIAVTYLSFARSLPRKRLLFQRLKCRVENISKLRFIFAGDKSHAKGKIICQRLRLTRLSETPIGISPYFWNIMTWHDENNTHAHFGAKRSTL